MGFTLEDFEKKLIIPWNDIDEIDKRHYIQYLTRKITELEKRIENLELRLNYSDRR